MTWLVKPVASVADVGASFAVASSAWLFAQADPASGWLSVIIQMGSFGLVAYLIVMGLPQLQKTIQQERETERKEFTGALGKITEDRKVERVDFTKAMQIVVDASRHEAESVRAAAKAEVEALRATFERELRATREFYAAESAADRKMYSQAVADMRTAVHDVKDTASATVNRANVAIEVARLNQRGPNEQAG